MSTFVRPGSAEYPSALSRAKCFSTAFDEIPIRVATAVALNIGSSNNKEIIFSLPFFIFLPTAKTIVPLKNNPGRIARGYFLSGIILYQLSELLPVAGASAT